MTRAKYFFTVLIIIIVALICQIAWMEYKEDVKEQELELNASWNAGWDLGYAWGAYNIFEEVMLKGFFTHNETWVIYSPEGCLRAIEYEGCEVVCAGR